MSEPSCRLCGGPAASLLTAVDRNRGIAGGPFRYERCERCGTVQIADVPSDLGRYYAGAYHGVPTEADLGVRAVFDQPKVDLLLEHVRPGRLVEIGPSWGGFALLAKRAGFDVTTVEMDPECCAFLTDVIGVRAIRSATPQEVLPGLPASRVVAMWHVLEHVPDPWAVLEAAAENLEPGGVLAVAVPNPEALQLTVLGRRWAHLDAPRHLFLIPHGTLVARAAELGLEEVATTTTDPFGRHCNRFGWEYALRRRPASGPSGTLLTRASQVLERLLAPVEHRGLRGAAYTVLLRRPAGG